MQLSEFQSHGIIKVSLQFLFCIIVLLYMEQKSVIRKEFLEKRKQLTTIQQEDWSMAIANKSLELPIWNLQYFHLYLPYSLKD